MTALLEYLDLLQCLKITVLGHVHLSACNINNSPHKLGFQFSMRAGDQKLRFDLVWPKFSVSRPGLKHICMREGGPFPLFIIRLAAF